MTSKPPLSEILSIDPEVLIALGKTEAQIARMGLHEFAMLSYDRGIEWKVSTDGGRVKGLTIAIRTEQKSAAS